MIGRFLILALCVFSAYSLPASKAKESLAAMAYSSKSLQDTGVINWPVVEAVVSKIKNLLTAFKTRTALTSTEVDNIIDIANKIENIVNIHSIQTRGVINISGFLDAVNSILGSTTTRSTLTVAQLENILKLLNEIEGIVNIHSLETAPEAQISEGVINVPVVIDVLGNIEKAVGSLKTRSTLTSADVETIFEVLNKIEGIVNIH